MYSSRVRVQRTLQIRCNIDEEYCIHLQRNLTGIALLQQNTSTLSMNKRVNVPIFMRVCVCVGLCVYRKSYSVFENVLYKPYFKHLG